VIVDDPADAAPLVSLAATYGGAETTGVVTLIRLTQSGDLASLADSLTEMDALQRTVIEAGLTCNVITRGTADRTRDLVAELASVAPGAVVVGPESDDLIAGLVRSGADVLEMRRPVDLSHGAAVSSGGSNDELAALELAARAALTHHVPVAVTGTMSSRSRRQLQRLGVIVEANSEAVAVATVSQHVDDAALTVHAGERDRVPLAELLGSWLDHATVVAHASR
jgi:hypothetical protein